MKVISISVTLMMPMMFGSLLSQNVLLFRVELNLEFDICQFLLPMVSIAPAKKEKKSTFGSLRRSRSFLKSIPPQDKRSIEHLNSFVGRS